MGIDSKLREKKNKEIQAICKKHGITSKNIWKILKSEKHRLKPVRKEIIEKGLYHKKVDLTTMCCGLDGYLENQ